MKHYKYCHIVFISETCKNETYFTDEVDWVKHLTKNEEIPKSVVCEWSLVVTYQLEPITPYTPIKNADNSF